MPESSSSHPLIVVPDCNVLIHGKALHSLPWEEWGRDAIEILIVGPVLGELDAVKNRPGRPGRIARDVNSEIRTLLDKPGHEDLLRAGNPRVTRRLWLGQKEARGALREGIDLAHGDQAIINRALWWLDRGREVVFLTDDTLAAANAQEFGLPYRLLPQTWLRPAATDETQKETARLKAQIAQLQASEPRLEGWFEDAAGQRIDRIDATLKRYAALAPELVEALIARVSHANPMVQLKPPSAAAAPVPRTGPVDIAAIGREFEHYLAPLMARAITKYEEEYIDWLEQVRGQLRDLHITWQRRREWPRAAFMGVNKGNRPASKALVELVVDGNFTIRRPRKWTREAQKIDEQKRRAELSIKMPPAPPRPQLAAASLLGLSDSALFDRGPVPFFDPLARLNTTRDVDAFYWRTGKNDVSDRMELECENWRHQREPEDFVFQIGGGDAQRIEGLVTGTLSAANVTTAIQARLPVRIVFTDQPLKPIAEQMVAEFERVSPRWRRAQKIVKPRDAES
jgi:hypothetical protein